MIKHDAKSFIEKLLATFLLMLLTVAAPSCRDREPGQRETNPEKKFSITYPENWEIQENLEDYDVIGRSPQEGPGDNFRENLWVASTEMKDPLTGDEILDFNLSAMINILTDFKPEKRDHAEVSGIEAARLTFTWRQGVHQLKSAVYAVPGRDRAYLIRADADAGAWDRFAPTFEKIIKSIEVKP